MYTSKKRSSTETPPTNLDAGDSKRLAVDQTQVQMAGSPTTCSHQLRFQQREYRFGELSLVVKCRALPSVNFDDYVASGEDSSGLDIWEAASAVCDFLVKYLSVFQDLPSIRVIELGAGLPSLVAAKLGCDVTLTDFDPNALELARENVKLNFLEKWCSVLSLDVQADLAKTSQLTEEGYDVVCAADILYASMMARPTVSMVARLLKPKGVLLIAHQPRFTEYGGMGEETMGRGWLGIGVASGHVGSGDWGHLAATHHGRGTARLCGTGGILPSGISGGPGRSTT
ncbi:hypothetical protein CYMTET_31623 [Cymbomonas tetramitiformis]|uniref:Uncharacterized protein n=1 Tax=Cymbomonas tetramitiformis TaxID=36881 RepID=A0AAE0FGH0_9CHLO|nr:hypothetical protein CYMTET_31623 [Cymbomonas tetramitiformis]